MGGCPGGVGTLWSGASETGVSDPRPKLLGFTCQVWPPTPKGQIKRHGEGRERRFITQLGTHCGKRQSKHSAHLQPSSGYTHWILGLNWQRIGGRGQVKTVLVTGVVWLTIISVLVLWGFCRSCHHCHHLKGVIWFPRHDYSCSRVQPCCCR
jgi:hypothetical protein